MGRNRKVRNRWWVAVTLVALALGATSCELPTDPNAMAFNASPAPSGCSGPLTVTIYLVNNATERLAPVRRPNVARSGNSALCALDELSIGPTAEEEIQPGLTTAFVGIPHLGLVSVSNGTAVVGLDPQFQAISGKSKQVLAFGQIVYTLTSISGIDRVQFDFDNVAYAAVQLPGGALRTTGLVSKADYCAIGPPGQNCDSLRKPAKA
jgi:spore germination protein GerM